LKAQFSLYDLLIIIGILQGIIISFLLFVSKKNGRSNKFLALALLSFCFLSTKVLLHTLHLWDIAVFRFFPNAIELALAPLVYFYITSLVNPEFRFKRRNCLHFIPFFISQTYAFFVYFTIFNSSDFAEKDRIASSLLFDQIKQLDEFLLLISITVYLFYGHKELKKYKKWLIDTTSDGTFPDFSWLQHIFGLFIIIGFFSFINHSLDLFFHLKNTTSLHWDLLMLFITFIIYYLGFKGYLQPDYDFSRRTVLTNDNSTTIVSDEKSTEIIERLKKVMETDKAYLNPKLTIYELSNLLKTSERSLSQIINQHFKISFRDFINTYRLEEVKLKLNDVSFKNMSILGIALECGFNSEASFYRVFKKYTGLSPKEFIKKSQ